MKTRLRLLTALVLSATVLAAAISTAAAQNAYRVTEPALAYQALVSPSSSVIPADSPAAAATDARPSFDLNAAPAEATFPDAETYLAEHIAYGPILQANDVRGTVELAVTVGADGYVERAIVTESLHEACDQAAVDAVLEMPRWTPARSYGRAVPSRVVIRVEFGG